MDNNIFGRTSRMKITYMLHENVIYIYKSWYSIFPPSLPSVCVYIYCTLKGYTIEWGLWFSMLWKERRKKMYLPSYSQSKIKCKNRKSTNSLYNKTILTLIPPYSTQQELRRRIKNIRDDSISL